MRWVRSSRAVDSDDSCGGVEGGSGHRPVWRARNGFRASSGPHVTCSRCCNGSTSAGWDGDLRGRLPRPAAQVEPPIDEVRALLADVRDARRRRAPRAHRSLRRRRDRRPAGAARRRRQGRRGDRARRARRPRGGPRQHHRLPRGAAPRRRRAPQRAHHRARAAAAGRPGRLLRAVGAGAARVHRADDRRPRQGRRACPRSCWSPSPQRDGTGRARDPRGGRHRRRRRGVPGRRARP